MLNSFSDFIKERLQKPLPGREAHIKMAPSPLSKTGAERKYAPENEDYRNSSVLVPIIAWNGRLEIVLTLRTQSIKHGGQISFPGGGREGLETIEEAALREAQEEIGIQPELVTTAGRLTPLYVAHSDNMVTPVIGFMHTKQIFRANPNEVDEIFTVALKDLIHKDFKEKKDWNLRGQAFQVPFWNIHKVPLWGATAMIISELVDLYTEYLDTQKD